MITAQALLGLAVLLPAAANDNNVEWDGVTHIGWLDRSPECPVNGEAFTVRFQTFRYDITSARVQVDDGTQTWVDAYWSHANGPYDVWTANVPSTVASSLEYYLELTDGSDIDFLGPPGLGADGMSESAPASGWVLDFNTLSHAPLGATLTSDGGAVFRVWAPGATSAQIRGTFNNWGNPPGAPTPMSTADNNYWYGQAAGVSNYAQYKYYFNGSLWKEDARARALNPGNNNNSYVVDPTTYVWGDRRFTIPPFEEMVIYELHVGTFSGRNDGLNRMGRFRDVVDTHLDHLLYLGVNAIELMPITEFDYHESWGYNPVNCWGPENAYGSPDDLKYLIDVLHRNGIAVLLDIVYNHFSFSGNYLWYYDGAQIYFDSPACDTPWGSQAAFWKQQVRDYYAQNVLYWLDEYHVDGFRMDATSYMRDPLGCYPQGWSLMQEINDRIDARKINAISIAEELPDNTAITTPTSLGGAGFHSQWHDRFVDDIRQEIFDAALGNPEMWRVRDAIIDTSFPNKTHVVNYVESHDEAGDESGGERLAVTIDSGDPYSIWAKGRSKLAQGLTLLAPGIPMFLMGGEWMEDIQFGSGWNNRIDWSKAAGRAPIVLFFRDAISVRKSNCGLRSDAGCVVHHVDETNNVIGFHRWDWAGNDLILVAGFNNGNLTGHRIGFPQSGTWYEILNSQASDYDGNGWGNGGSIVTEAVPWDGMAHSAAITVPQMGLLVFRFEDPPGRGVDLNGDGHVDLYDYSLLQQEAGAAGCGMSADFNEDGRVNADDVAELANSLTGPV